MLIAAVEARDSDAAVREVRARRGARLVGAVGTVAVVVVDLGMRDGNRGVREAGEGVFGRGSVEPCVWVGVSGSLGGFFFVRGVVGNGPSGETPRGTVARATDALDESRSRRLFCRMVNRGARSIE